MLEFADTELCELCARDEGENNVSWETLLQVCLDAECVCSVNKYAGMLRSNDRLNYCRKIVDVWQCLYTKQNIVECALLGVGCIFWSSDN